MRGVEELTKKTPPAIRDRIVDFRRVPAADLLPNPANWRTHPDEQRDALAGVLESVGIVDAVIARETPEGLELIDGHLPQETLTGDIPVIVVDLNDDEAAEQLNRKCYGIEISPAYVAVTLQRYADATGKQPTLIEDTNNG